NLPPSVFPGRRCAGPGVSGRPVPVLHGETVRNRYGAAGGRAFSAGAWRGGLYIDLSGRALLSGCAAPQHCRGHQPDTDLTHCAEGAGRVGAQVALRPRFIAINTSYMPQILPTAERVLQVFEIYARERRP